MKKIILFFFMSCSVFALKLEKENYTKDTPGYHCEIEIPKLLDGDKKVKDKFNKKMNKKIKEYIFKNYTLDEMGRKVEKILKYEVYNSNFGVTSIVFNEYEYTGGAHGNSVKKVYLLNEKTGKVLNINNYLSEKEKEKIKEKVKEEIKKDPSKYFVDSKIDLKDAVIYFNQDKVIIEFGLYSIAPYSSGMPKFEFKKEELK